MTLVTSPANASKPTNSKSSSGEDHRGPASSSRLEPCSIAICTFSRTVSAGKDIACWNVRPRPRRPINATDCVEEGRLARAIRTDNSEDLIRLDRHIDACERDDAAERLAQALYLESRHRRTLLRSTTRQGRASRRQRHGRGGFAPPVDSRAPSP